MAGTGCYYVRMSLIASKIAQYKVNIVVLLQQVSPLAIPTELPWIWSPSPQCYREVFPHYCGVTVVTAGLLWSPPRAVLYCKRTAKQLICVFFCLWLAHEICFVCVYYRFLRSVNRQLWLERSNNELSSVWCSWGLSTTRSRTTRISGICGVLLQ